MRCWRWLNSYAVNVMTLTFTQDCILKWRSSVHHASCCHISSWINKIVIIKGVWENWKKLCFNAIFSCLVKYALWLTAVVCSLLDLCVKGLEFFICPSHLSALPQVTWVSLLFFLSSFAASLILVLYTDLIAGDFMPHCYGILWKREMSMI